MMTPSQRKDVATDFIQKMMEKYPKATTNELLEITKTMYVATVLLNAKIEKQSFSSMKKYALKDVEDALEEGYAKVAAIIFGL